MTTPVWVDRPGHKSGSHMSNGGGGRDTVQNIVVELQLWLMDRFRYLVSVAHS